MNSNEKAFLGTLAVSELGKGLISISDNGYNVIVGSTVDNPDLFDDYSDHPRKLVKLSETLKSTAAGRYQILAHIFDSYKESLGLSDFSPESQDAIALQIIKECHAIEDIDSGDLTTALAKCAHIWASLPGAGYGQHENQLSNLQDAFVEAGGTLTGDN